MISRYIRFIEMDYSILVLTLLLATVAAESPFTSKRYRPDYDYNKHTDAFYKLHTERALSMRAHSVCEAEGAKLISPESDLDLKQIHGMFKQFPDLGNLVLVDGNGEGHDQVDNDEIPMINLEEDDVSGPIRHQCEVVNRKGVVERFACYPELPFICKIPAKDAPYNKECDTYSNDYVSKISLTGSCYRIAKLKADWNEAYANCQAEGAHLAILNNEVEYEIVKGLLDKTPRYIEDWQFFVGVRAEKTVPVVYRTVFNQTLDEVGYQPWDAGEPNNAFGVEYCVSLLKTTGKYNDTVCRNRYSYVCEKERRT